TFAQSVPRVKGWLGSPRRAAARSPLTSTTQLQVSGQSWPQAPCTCRSSGPLMTVLLLCSGFSGFAQSHDEKTAAADAHDVWRLLNHAVKRRGYSAESRSDFRVSVSRKPAISKSERFARVFRWHHPCGARMSSRTDLTPASGFRILGDMTLARRIAAVAAILALGAGNVAVCASWQATPEARMACCMNGTTCPMHKSDGHDHSSKRSFSQTQADTCCAASSQRRDSSAAGSLFTSSGLIALIE